MEPLSLSLGEAAGAAAPTPQEFEERVRILEEKVRRDAREIVEVLKVDFPRFVERVVKERFVSSRDFADALSDQDLRALKADVAKTGKQAVGELVPPLEEWRIWLDLPGPLPAAAERRDLHRNPEVQARLQRVGALVAGLLERHKLPGLKEEELKEAYKFPSWFVAGRLVMSLVESYWRNMEEYQGILEALRSLSDRGQRAKRAERWDSV